MGVRNEAGDTLVNFAMSHDLVVMNTFFKKAERHKLTYKSGSVTSQIDYILCKRKEQHKRL